MTAPLIAVVELRPNGPNHPIRTNDRLLTRCGLNVGPLDLVYEIDSSDVDLCKRCLNVKNHL